MIEDAEVGFYAGYEVVQADALPTWTPGDEFAAIRKQALAQVAQH